MNNQLDFATLNERFHERTPYEMARRCKQLLSELPSVTFEQLQIGMQVYYDERTPVYTVISLTAKRSFADVSYGMERRRISRTNYRGTFKVLNPEMISLVSVTHEQIVGEAKARGLAIPPEVRVLYPELFIEVPERFTIERVREVLRPQWGKHMTSEALGEMIETCHRSIRRLQDEWPKALALNPNVSGDYERYIADNKHDIDLYRWLQTLVGEGGIFYVKGRP